MYYSAWRVLLPFLICWGGFALASVKMGILMKNIILLAFFVFWAFLSTQVVYAATVTCEVQEVRGDKIILVNCDAQRAKGFKPGNKVKLKLKKGKK